MSEKLKSPLLLLGLIFLVVNISTSYMFYHVNTYKIMLVLLGITIFTICNIMYPTNINTNIPWKIWGILLMPLLATFPGLIQYQFKYNYNFRYELATNLILILWVIFLYCSTKQIDNLNIFLIFIGITVIYISYGAIFTETGRVKSTFGNTNYFAGFLVITLPILLTQAIPNKKIKLINLFYIIAFILGTKSLLLTQTRAAIVAFLISLVLVSFLYFYIKRKFLLLAICFITIVSFSMFIFNSPRFTSLLKDSTWGTRLAPWTTAVTSIKASPIFGFGLGSSYNLYSLFFSSNVRLLSGYEELNYNHAHSEILEYLQESGLVGLVVFIIFWVYIIRLLIKLLHTNNNMQLKLVIGIFGGLLAYHIHGSFSVATRMMVVKLPFYTLIGLTLILNKLNINNVE